MKKFALVLALATTLSVTVVGASNYWNGDTNYPEVLYTANGTETYYFDTASLFKTIDSSRNFIFGVNVVTMHNNQYGEGTLYKYIVLLGMNTVCRYDENDLPHPIERGRADWNIFIQAWKLNITSSNSSKLEEVLVL